MKDEIVKDDDEIRIYLYFISCYLNVKQFIEIESVYEVHILFDI